MRFRSFAVASLLISACFVLASIDQGVLLRRKLIPHDVTKYKLVMTMKSTATMPDGSLAPQGEMGMEGDYTLTTGDSIKDGKIPISVKTSNMRLTGPTGANTKPADVTMNGFVDELNTISDVKMDTKDSQALGNSMSSMMDGINSFPNKAVQPGDTWDVLLPMSAMGSKDIQLKMRYDGERTEKGKTYWVVHVDQDVPMTIDLAAMGQPSPNPGGPPMIMKGMLHMKVEALYDLDGRNYSVAMDSNSDMSVDGPNGGKIRVQSDQTMNMTEQ